MWLKRELLILFAFFTTATLSGARCLGEVEPCKQGDTDTPILKYLSFSSYYTLKPIRDKGYFQIGRRYIHPPVVEWWPVPGVVRYELILVQCGQILGITPAVSSPQKIQKGWDKAKAGISAAVIIQGFDAKGNRVALSPMFPFYVAPDYDPAKSSKQKRPYYEAAVKTFNALYDYKVPQKAIPSKASGDKVLPILLGCAEGTAGLLPYSFPNLHDWIHVEMLLAMNKIADETLKRKITNYARSVGEHLLMCRIQTEGYLYKGMIRGCADFSGGPAVGIINSKDEREKRLVEPGKCGYSAEALVKIYELTRDVKYLDAAIQMAEVLVKTQRKDGSWHARVDARTGEVLGDYSTSVISVASFLDRLNQHRPDMNYDDGRARATKDNPYAGLSNWDLFVFIRYLAKNSNKIENAVYYIQDNLEWNDNHFVFYGSDPLLPFEPFYPCVAEQGNPRFYPHGCWTPMDFHTGNWGMALMAAWQVTKNTDYLQKARAAANTLTQYQLESGRTHTWMCDSVLGVSSRLGYNFWPAGWAMSAWLWAELAAMEP
ncbi:MAG: hypothetical protein ACYSSI_14520 [Planctomycetota bacterium]|jgi:hypothetical protein